MKQVTRLTDDYCLDGLIGLVPGGFGDMIAGLFSMVHIYFGLFKLRSIPLNDDANIVHEVNRKAVQAAIIFFLLIACIFAMLWLLVWIAEKIGTFLFT